MNDAETCRQNGWVRGQYLRGDEGHGPEIIQITAVGDEMILARLVHSKGKTIAESERTWTLSYRVWEPVYKVDTPTGLHLGWTGRPE